jgi:hypothetical protein
LFLLLASLRRNLSGLGRRVHRGLVGADVTEQDRAVRQILFHQAGAGRGNRARSNRVARDRVVVPPAVPPHVTMAVAVEVEAVPVEVAVPVMEVNVPVVPVMVVVTVVVVTVTVVVVVTMVAAVMTDHMAMTVTTAVTVTATVTVTAAMAAGISSSRDERRQANDGRGDESEECSTFEHSEGPLGLRPFGST